MIATMPAPPRRPKSITFRATIRVAGALSLVQGRLSLSRDRETADIADKQTILNACIMQLHAMTDADLEAFFRSGVAAWKSFDLDGYRDVVGGLDEPVGDADNDPYVPKPPIPKGKPKRSKGDD